ncbi:MAG: putative lipid II flippase FtsW [Oscillospiraceae bacterium]|nr:putative lipid II flippase FtsW [Oscillospiraceae bacterium]
MDLPFMVLVIVILAVGVIMVLSASYASCYYKGISPTIYFKKQLFFAVGGIVVMYVISRIKVSWIWRLSPVMMVIAIVLLVAVLFIGIESHGAKRWLGVSETFSFQPSEIVKPAIVMYFAYRMTVYQKKMNDWRQGILPYVIILGIVILLLAQEPHYSCAIIVASVGGVMMIAGGSNWKFLLAVVVLGATVAVVYVLKIKSTMALGKEAIDSMRYASARIVAWLDPYFDPKDIGFQIIQSLYAVGSGGFLGLGLGQSRQKFMYLPEEHNDFIFSVVCEELGFLGAMLILVLFALLILRGFWLALNARDRFGSLVITGLISLLAIQVFLNVAVVVNLVPCTGISLPFFSYGGTALLIQLAEMGVILSISREIPLKDPVQDKVPEKVKTEKTVMAEG